MSCELQVSSKGLGVDWLWNLPMGMVAHTSGCVWVGPGGVALRSVWILAPSSLALLPCSASQLPGAEHLCSALPYSSTMMLLPWNQLTMDLLKLGDTFNHSACNL